MTYSDTPLSRAAAALDEDIAAALAYRPGALGDGPTCAPRVHLVNARDLTPEAVRWLWQGWLALGKVHVLAGAPGTGKTTLAMAIAAIFTTAGRWPDGTRCAEAGSVLVWSGEDDPADTLLPRLLAAGAARERCFFVGGTRDADGNVRPFDPATDLDDLGAAIEAIGDVRLLVIDPIVSAVTGDSHKNTEVRRALQHRRLHR